MSDQIVVPQETHPLLVEDEVVAINHAGLYRRQQAALHRACIALSEGREFGDIHAEDEARNAVRAYLEHMHATEV